MNRNSENLAFYLAFFEKRNGWNPYGAVLISLSRFILELVYKNHFYFLYLT